MSRRLLSETDPRILEGLLLGEDAALAAAERLENGVIGRRVARLRKERGLTQKELAEMLGVTQPVVSDYERGELRLHGGLIIELARIFGVTADEILGLEKGRAKASAAKNRRLLRRLKAIDELPKRDQEALIRTIDAFLSKAS